jgi:hypothetical protein
MHHGTMPSVTLPAAWRRWLAKTGKDETTHRAFYGAPVDLGQDETPYSWLPGTGSNLIPRRATRRVPVHRKALDKWAAG